MLPGELLDGVQTGKGTVYQLNPAGRRDSCTAEQPKGYVTDTLPCGRPCTKPLQPLQKGHRGSPRGSGTRLGPLSARYLHLAFNGSEAWQKLAIGWG